MDAYQRIVCEWCSNQNGVGATQCQFCGAPQKAHCVAPTVFWLLHHSQTMRW